MPYKEGVKSDFLSPKFHSWPLRSGLTHSSVGAALCCEEAGGSTEDSRFGHGPLRSTRLLLCMDSPTLSSCF